MSTGYLTIRSECRGVICVLAVSGTLDVNTVAGFTERVAAETAAHSGQVVLDMSAVRSIDSSGARALAVAASPVPGRRTVVVRSLRPASRRLLGLMGLNLAPPGPDLDPGGRGLPPRGGDGAAAGSPTWTLVHASRMARFTAAQAIEDSRRVVESIAATEDRIASTLVRLAAQRPQASGRLIALSQAARSQAIRMRRRAQGTTKPPAVAAAGPHVAATGTLRRALAFIDERAHDDIGVADIAAAAYVTPRAIQLAFRRQLGTTPMGYVRQVRLERARRQLIAADPARETVTMIAARCGFPSPSRFTAYYRAAYGVPPGQTLRHRGP